MYAYLGLECPVSTVVNSDTGPRPTTTNLECQVSELVDSVVSYRGSIVTRAHAPRHTGTLQRRRPHQHAAHDHGPGPPGADRRPPRFPYM
jgi:hypothetical protein